MAGTAVSKGKPGPKPRGPFQNKRRTLTTKITESTRKSLEEAAAGTDRSLSQEIEFRLEQSFYDDREYGGAQQRALFRTLAAVASVIEERTGKSWIEDELTAVAVNQAWGKLVQDFRPKLDTAKGLETITAELPAKPQAPDIERPRNPHIGLRRPPQETIDDFNRQMDEYTIAMDAFADENAEFIRKCERIQDQTKQYVLELRKHIAEYADLGRDAAESMFPSAEQARK